MSARVVLPQAVYRRATEPGALPAGMKLRALEWALYFAVSGTHTVAELGRNMGADAPERDEALGRLIGLALVEEQPLDAAAYVRALAAAGDREEKTLHQFLMAAARPADPEAAAPEPPRPPQPVRREGPMLREVANDTPLRPRPLPAFGFKPLPSPDEIKENRSMTRSRSLSLRALMTMIESRADSRDAGQLDIYRVFVRVDTLLLKRNGIETLRFTDDRLISDPELEQALVWSVKKTLGLECPESVWVDVA